MIGVPTEDKLHMAVGLHDTMGRRLLSSMSAGLPYVLIIVGVCFAVACPRTADRRLVGVYIHLDQHEVGWDVLLGEVMSSRRVKQALFLH